MSEAAQPARFVRTEPEARTPAEKPVSVLQTEGMDQSRPWSFSEASRAQRANDDAQALYDIEIVELGHNTHARPRRLAPDGGRRDRGQNP